MYLIIVNYDIAIKLLKEKYGKNQINLDADYAQLINIITANLNTSWSKESLGEINCFDDKSKTSWDCYCQIRKNKEEKQRSWRSSDLHIQSNKRFRIK